jgi:hypothetical protein
MMKNDIGAVDGKRLIQIFGISASKQRKYVSRSAFVWGRSVSYSYIVGLPTNVFSEADQHQICPRSSSVRVCSTGHATVMYIIIGTSINGLKKETHPASSGYMNRD